MRSQLAYAARYEGVAHTHSARWAERESRWHSPSNLETWHNAMSVISVGLLGGADLHNSRAPNLLEI